MGYQSKTWSLSDEVVAEIERRVELMTRNTGSGSPNRVLKEALFTPYVPKTEQSSAIPPPPTPTPGQVPMSDYMRGRPAPPARELLVELDGESDK